MNKAKSLPLLANPVFREMASGKNVCQVVICLVKGQGKEKGPDMIARQSLSQVVIAET